MKYLSLSLFFLLINVNDVFSQSISKSLYLEIDRTTDSIFESNSNTLQIRYKYINDKKNWTLILDHINIPNDKRNHFRYQLPVEMVRELKRKGNIQSISSFKNRFHNSSLKDIKGFFDLNYSYYYEYLDSKKLQVKKRYNVFIFFKSDLNKEYITFYEMDTFISPTVIEVE